MYPLEKLFDIEKFDSYKEDNRREVKKPTEVYPMICGKPILLMPTLMAVSLFWELRSLTISIRKRQA